MRQNVFSAIIQAGASLGIAFLSIAIFRFLEPEQVALLRQHYFVPFALVTAFSPANQNYLRSILFSKGAATDLRRDVDSVAVVQSMTGGVLLALIVFSISASGTDVTWLNVVALAVALLLVLARTIVTGILEFRGRYSISIALNNLGSAIPYLAAFSLVVMSEVNAFYVSTILLNAICVVFIFSIASRLSTRRVLSFVVGAMTEFRFDFRRYFSLSLISLGSVVVYQGVEFCLYNYTDYGNAEIASYALVFSISAILRQIILTAVQPLEREHSHNSSVKLPMVGDVARPIAVEMIVYVILVAAVVALPPILKIFFSKFAMAAVFVPPLVLGVLGSAIQQVYSVRMIALSRTSFLGGTQIVLALSSVLVVLLLNREISLVYMIWLTSVLIWLRGCIFIPLYAELRGSKFSLKLWATRMVLSATLFLHFI